jgi:hypothetical protein
MAGLSPWAGAAELHTRTGKKSTHETNEGETKMVKITTVEQALTAVREDGKALQLVPDKLKTAEICLEAVKKDGEALQYVPDKLKTAEMCLEAVKNVSSALEYVPENLRTAKIYLERVKQNGQALEDVPEKFRTAELCFAAVKQDVEALAYVPLNLKTTELCQKAVKQNGWALQYVPLNLKTAEMCLKAVKQTGQLLQYVPENLKTAEMCIETVKQDPRALEFVPESLKTAEMCREAVNYSGFLSGISMLQYVPEHLKTWELCLDAIKQNRGAFEFMPANLKTTEMCRETLSYYRQSIDFLPSDRYGARARSEKSIRDTVERIFKGMPEERKTWELCLDAVKLCGTALAHVPEHLKAAEMCLEAVTQDSSASEFVPESLKTAEFFLEVLKGRPWYRQEVISFVPEALREEVDRRSKSVAVVNIGALTQEKIHFEFFKLTEKELNSVLPNTPDRKFSVESDFVTDTIDVYVTIPDHREVPKSITVKFTNIGTSAEQREAAINCEGRVSKAELGGIVILHASPGKPRIGQSYRQKAEITLNFENRSETLICPISRTTTFSMCFYEAYEAQSGKIDSIGSINPHPEG